MVKNYRNYKLPNLNFEISGFTEILIHKTCKNKKGKLSGNAQLGISPYIYERETLSLYENQEGGTVIRIAGDQNASVVGYPDFGHADRERPDRNIVDIHKRFEFVHFKYADLVYKFGLNKEVLFCERPYYDNTPGTTDTNVYTTLVAHPLLGVPCPPGWPEGSIVMYETTLMVCELKESLSELNEKKMKAFLDQLNKRINTTMNKMLKKMKKNNVKNRIIRKIERSIKKGEWVKKIIIYNKPIIKRSK